jgi:hypothetical protein
MEVTLTRKQYVQLLRVPALFPIDTRDDGVDLRNLPHHLAAMVDILGKPAVDHMLNTGEEIKVRVTP